MSELRIHVVMEIQVLVNLKHPNLVNFKDLYLAKRNNLNILQVVMELVDGGALCNMMETQGLKKKKIQFCLKCFPVISYERRKKRNVSDIQVAEFLWAYLEVTATEPLNDNLEEAMEDENTAGESPSETETETEVDGKEVSSAATPED